MRSLSPIARRRDELHRPPNAMFNIVAVDPTGATIACETDAGGAARRESTRDVAQVVARVAQFGA
jgi:hypothetical protein